MSVTALSGHGGGGGEEVNYCNCIVTRGGVHDFIVYPDSSHSTVILNYLY